MVHSVLLSRLVIPHMCDAVTMATASSSSAPVFTHPGSMQSNRQMSLVVGDSVRLRCEARGSPTPEVVWYKDDAILADTGRHPITWSLELRHITVKDGGIYTCIVYNNIGAISYSYNVTVTRIYVLYSFFQSYYLCVNCDDILSKYCFYKHCPCVCFIVCLCPRKNCKKCCSELDVTRHFVMVNPIVSQKVAPLKLFAVFSLLVNLCN